MYIEINDEKIPVIITYKNNKNMYLRVKEDLSVHITAPKYISKKDIIKFLNDNQKSIIKMIMAIKNKHERIADKFLYLGNSYDICYTQENEVNFGQTKVFLPKKLNIEKWYRKQAEVIFKQHLEYCYEKFQERIPFPTLKIRNMTSKWGVCNITKRQITLNLNLIKLDLKYLDYVIVHELSHLIYANHSPKFWQQVEKYVPNYKQLRKEMKNIL